MFKNDTIKRVLKNTIFPVLSIVNKKIKKEDEYVLLYSPNRGIEHNLKPFKEYLLFHGFNKRYRIVCCVSSTQYFENDGLEYITQFKGFMFYLKAKHVFYTTGQIPIKPSDDQIVIQMDHGTTAIKTEGYLKKRFSGDVNYFSLYCAPSILYKEIVKKEFRCSDNNIIINSEPVTDVLYQGSTPIYLGNYKKIGLWTPTFRKSDYLGYDDSEEEELLPTLKEDDYYEFNKILEELDIKVIVKLHDMQNIKQNCCVDFSNLVILSSDDFNKMKYQLYELLKQIDFLLADYSSVFLQFLPLNKPIGFVVPDLEDYREKRGFVFEPVEDYMPGPLIRTKEELYSFMYDMSNSKDEYMKERKKINDLVNAFQDGKSCERLIMYSNMN